MINLIGALIVGIIGLAMFMHPPPLKDWNQALEQPNSRLPQVVILLLMLWFCLRIGFPGLDKAFLFAYLPGLVLDGANLWIHEAGHGFLMWAPAMIAIAGGTVLQLAVPLAVLFYCLKRKYFYMAPVFLFWFGANFPSVGTYIADARAQKLELFGGGEGSVHDWHALLEFMGLLPYDTILGAIVWWLAFPIMGAAMIWVLIGAFIEQGSDLTPA